MNEAQINSIVEQVVRRLSGELGKLPSAAPSNGASRAPAIISKRPGIHDDLDSAVTAATRAQEQWMRLPVEGREKVIEAMRQCTRDNVNELSSMAVAETKLGNVADKVKKNLLCANKTPGMEILKTHAVSGDHGLMLIERAPFGVIGAITPSTNATETIINNGVAMVAGGNSVVFNVHPSAKGVVSFFITKLNESIVAAGGPANLLCMLGTPTIESAGALMKHPGIRLIVVTGGPAVVKAAMGSGKRAICGGPGNPPVVVDETARLDVAARGITRGASFDNNVICTDEKEVLVVSSVADQLKELLVKEGNYMLNERQIRELEKIVVDGDHPAKDFVGKNASVILKTIGVNVSDECRLVMAEVPEEHPFIQHELLMPVVGIARYNDVASAIAGAKRVEHGFGHTASMYSTNIDALSAMARTINTSIFIKNGPNFNGLGAGGEGYTSFTIASPTGEGLTTAVSFTRERRCTLQDHFRFV